MATSGAQRGGVLADAAGEGHRVKSAHGGGVSANGLLHLVDQNGERLGGARVARAGGLLQIAHIAACDPRKTGQSTAFGELLAYLPAGPAVALHHEEHGECVQIAMPGSVLQTRLRREAHGSVDGSAAVDGAQRRTAAQVAAYQAGLAAQQRGASLGHILVRSAVEAVPAHALGFHGASHQYVAERCAALLGRQTRLVSCHLGGSSSLCAIDRGRSIDTTMGFSPQSGLENATRHGDLDAFAVLFMMERHGWTCGQVREQLAKGGGLAGLSGIAGGDVRDLEQAAGAGHARAAEALAVLVYQVKKTIGAYAAAMGGLDAVAFTGGIGENSATLRAACCHGLEFLNIALDPESNAGGSGDRIVSNGPVAVLALATNEELIVARRAFQLLTSA